MFYIEFPLKPLPLPLPPIPLLSVVYVNETPQKRKFVSYFVRLQIYKRVPPNLLIKIQALKPSRMLAELALCVSGSELILAVCCLTLAIA